MTSKLEAALALAARGFKVFPLAHNAKAPPLVKDWPDYATDNPDYIRSAWGVHGEANIGIHCDGFIVIDVDVKKGGNESLQLLEMMYGLPETLTTVTPSGGRHLFYRSLQPVSNSVSALGAGLDVRSQGGYVVAPGSTVPSGKYRFQSERDIADAPEWLVLKLGTVVPKTGTTDLNVPDAPEHVVERAREWLKGAERSVKGQGGDQTAYRVACHLRDFGISYPQACDLMRSDAWDLGCGWREGRLEDKPIRSAYRYAQNEPGAAIAKAEDFPIVQHIEQNSKPRAKVSRLADFAASETRGPGYLIKGLLARRSYAETFGAPGEGKTFAALDMAYCVAAGTPWMGRKVHAGPVLYLAYEGQGGLVKRAQALRRKYGTKDIPLYVAGCAINLREQAGRQELGRLIAELPEKPVLIVIDTFARALMGGDENSAQDVGSFNSAIAALIESTGACVMIIHHSGKNKSAGARGSSALQGAIDTEIEVDGGKVTASKQRDMETGEPIGFKLVPMVVGLDEDGDEVTSCVVEPDAVAAGPNGKISGNAKRGFDVLCEIRPDNSPVADYEWRDRCCEFLGNKDVAKRFYDIKRVLRMKGYIVIDEQGRVTRRCE
jgi:hypothetical protein